MIGIYWSIDILLSLISTAIAALVFIFYAGTVIKQKTKFTLALFAFSFAFLLQSAISTVIFYYFAHYYTASVAIPLMLLMAFELAGLASLLYIVQS